MESGCSTIGPSKGKRAGSGTRKIWKPSEECVLMDCLKELIASGQWKGENGFRGGYIIRLEKMMREKLGHNDIRGNPHINSHMTIWRRHHAALQAALDGTGGGFNTEMKVLDVSDSAWDRAVKREPTIHSMRYKPWPLYNDWLKVFGNDGATGGSSQTVVDAANEETSEDDLFDENNRNAVSNENANTEAVDMEVESQAGKLEMSLPPTTLPTNTKKRSLQSTVGTNNRDLLNGLDVLCKDSDERLDQIVQSLVVQAPIQPQTRTEPHPQTHSESSILSRSEVFKIIDNITCFTLDERLDAADKITKNSQRLEMFSGLSEYARPRYVRRLLDGHFDKL